jgi:CRISPR/Cas system-associated endonuclease Cas3-HD
MVVSQFLSYTHLIGEDKNYKVCLLACFLHDVGKGFAKHTREGKTYMSGHELMAASISLRWLNEHQELFDLTDEDIEEVIGLVLGHTNAHKEEVMSGSNLYYVNLSDQYGRISKEVFND